MSQNTSQKGRPAMINTIAAGVAAWIVATSLNNANAQAVGWPLGFGLIVGSLLWALSEGYFTGPDVVALRLFRIRRSRRVTPAEQIQEMPELSELVEIETVLPLVNGEASSATIMPQ
jgi:hypothetical protein